MDEEYAIGCLGKYRTPVPEDRTCPVCGNTVEVFARAGKLVDESVCPRCGHLFPPQDQPIFAPEQQS